MYFIKRKIYRWFFKLIGMNPAKMPMVKYWKSQDTVRAKVTTDKEGVQIMYLQGEDYPMTCFPRSHMLFGNYKGTGFGPLSVLKHTIKNEVFNYAYYALQQKGKNDVWEDMRLGKTEEEVIKGMKAGLKKAYEIINDLKYDLIPPEKMSKPTREVYRAMTVIAERHPESNSIPLRDIITEIMAEDDSYCFRIQFLVPIFSFIRNPIKNLDIALQELEVGEVVGDMKERIRLLRKGLSILLSDPKIKQLFLELWKEIKWNKLKMSKGDIYYFRAKYFKADLLFFEY